LDADRRIRDRLEAVATALKRRPVLVLLAWSILYFAATLTFASKKLLWDDEFFTLALSRLPRFSDLWVALLTGADQHPPAFYRLTHFSMYLFGTGPIGLRLPAILGFWILTLSVFAFVSRRTSTLYGYVAMLAVCLTRAFYFAYEARGYGLALGFTGLALVGWQAAAEDRGRPLVLLGLAAALAAAVACHYYTVLILIPLGVGELLRSAARRRLDIPMWLAFLSPAAVLVACGPLIRASGGYARTFWATPSWADAFLYFVEVFGTSVVALAGTLVILSVWLVSRGRTAPGSETSAVRPPFHEIAAAGCLLGLPFATVTIAMLVTNAFHYRYVLSPIIGWSVLLAFLAYWLTGGHRLVAFGILVLLTGWFGINSVLTFRRLSGRRAQFEESAAFLQAQDPALPIVVTEMTQFYQHSFYSPPEIKRRLVYLADPRSELRFLGHDTVDRGLLELRPWSGLNVVDYATYIGQQRSFLVWGSLTDWTWQTFRMAEDGVDARLVGRHDSRLLLLVDPRNCGESERRRQLRPLLERKFPGHR
jgi:hypothetical protein